MADTIPNVVLPKGEWVDLYDTTGITVGTQIIVQNLTTSHVRLVTKATIPVSGDGFNTLPPFESLQNQSAATGAWAFSSNGGAVNVSEV